MTITEFRDRLVTALNSALVPEQIKNEQDFENQFVVPVVLVSIGVRH